MQTSAKLLMKNSDLCDAKVWKYIHIVHELLSNGMYCSKEGILIGKFLGEYYDNPKVTMVNNVIHNNKGYGVVLADQLLSDVKDASAARTEGNI